MKKIYFNLSPRTLPLTVDSIGNRWDQEKIHRPKGFPHYHWLQTELGTGEAQIGQNLILLPPGSGILIAPFVPHAYRASRGRWLTSFVTFSGTLEAQIPQILGAETFICVNAGQEFSFQEWIDRVIHLYEAGSLDPLQLSVDCYSFLLHISRFSNYGNFRNNPLYLRYVEPTIKEIETAYSQELTVRGLAEKLYISPQYLSRLFNRFFGCSVYAWLTDFRLKKAKELLVSRPDLTVSQISSLAGFHDASRFISSFKQNTGTTPLVFRRLHQ